MVRFAEKLIANRVLEWSDSYVDYDALKRVVKDVSRRLRASELAEANLILSGAPHLSTTELAEREATNEATPRLVTKKSSSEAGPHEEGQPLLRAHSSSATYTTFNPHSETAPGALLPLEPSQHVAPGPANPDEDYFNLVRTEALKVEAFYQNKLEDLRAKFEHADDSLDRLINRMENRFEADASESDEEFQNTPRRTNSAPKLSKSASVRPDLRASASLKRAFVDLYVQLNYLLSFCILNYTAFVKIAKKHDKVTGRNGKKRTMRLVSAHSFCEATELKKVIAQCEKSFSDAFHGGNLTVARSDLLARNRATSETEMLHIGFRLGVVAVLLCWVVWVVAIDALVKPSSAQLPAPIFMIYRGMSTFIIGVWLWAGCLYVWDNARINHVFLFEFDAKDYPHPMNVLKRASTLTIVYLLNLLVYLKIARGELNFFHVSSAKYLPIGLVVLLLLVATYTRIGAVGWPALGAVLVTPMYEVTFFHSFVADVLTSLVRPLVDLAFTVCFVFSGDWSSSDYSDNGGVCMNSWFYHAIVVPLVISLPLYWRFAQCLRRYHDTGHRSPNVYNATKYAVAYTVVLFGTLHPKQAQEANGLAHSPSRDVSSYHFAWTVSAVVSTCITYSWDVWMDWGLGRPGAALLRDRLMLSVKWPYYLAIFFDFGLRFLWVLTLFPSASQFFSEPRAGVVVESPLSMYATALLGWAEISRRAMWAIFRVEHEHLVNTQGFRRVDFVPLHFDTDPASDEVEKAGLDRRERLSLIAELFCFSAAILSVAVFAFVWQLSS